jgi:hypothetical protein
MTPANPIPLPDIPTTGLSDLFVHLMADAMEVDEEEARLILKLN